MLPLLTGVQVIAASGAKTIQPENNALKLVIITGVGCTATVSRVDLADATAHTTGTENTPTAAATITQNVCEVIEVDWPYYRISASGGALRYALI